MKPTNKPTTPQRTARTILLPATFCLACVLFAFTSTVLPQTAAKDKDIDHKKNFGKSLDKFKKKVRDTSGKDTKIDPTGDDVIRIHTDMVLTDVLVVNPKGNALVGLKKEDFLITENGVAQEMELFSNGAGLKIPKTIVFVVEAGDIPFSADKSLEAAKKLVDKLDAEDRMAIVSTNMVSISRTRLRILRASWSSFETQ